VINYDKRLFPNSFVLWNVCNAEVRRWYWHKKAKKRKKKPHCSINFIFTGYIRSCTFVLCCHFYTNGLEVNIFLPLTC